MPALPGRLTRAALVDKWVQRFDPPKTCIKALTGANSTSFWSAFWELATAATMVEFFTWICGRALPGV